MRVGLKVSCGVLEIQCVECGIVCSNFNGDPILRPPALKFIHSVRVLLIDAERRSGLT